MIGDCVFFLPLKFNGGKGAHLHNLQGNQMEIKEIINNLDLSQKSRIRSERADIIRQFLEEINKERIGTKFKPMTGRGVAIKVGHLKDNGTLYYFLSECKDYKNRHGSFSKYFFGALKIK